MDAVVLLSKGKMHVLKKQVRCIGMLQIYKEILMTPCTTLGTIHLSWPLCGSKTWRH